MTTVYTEPVDIVAKFEDAEEISSSTYFPGSIIDYPEDINIPLDQTTIQDGRTSKDHIVISLSDIEPSLIESVGTKLGGLIADTVSTDLSISEKDAAKKARKETGDGLILDVLEAYKVNISFSD